MNLFLLPTGARSSDSTQFESQRRTSWRIPASAVLRQWIRLSSARLPARAGKLLMRRAQRTSLRRTKHASPAERVARQSVAIAITCRLSDAKVVIAAARVRAQRRPRTPPAINRAHRPHQRRVSTAPDWKPAAPDRSAARAPNLIALTLPRIEIEIATAIGTNLPAILPRVTVRTPAATRFDEVRAAKPPYDFIAIRSTSARCNGCRPVACSICSRQLKPSAMISVS